MDPSTEPICLHDVELKAQQRLSESALQYYRGGADDELTLKNNIKAFQRLGTLLHNIMYNSLTFKLNIICYFRIRLRPRMLRGVTKVDMSTTILGHEVSMPICVSPTGIHRLANSEGEKATARGQKTSYKRDFEDPPLVPPVLGSQKRVLNG